MAIIAISASPTGNAQSSSGFAGGNVNLWSAGSGNVGVSVPAGQGSSWVVWQIKVPGLIPGQPVNGIKLSGTNDFTVGGGGGGIVRVATPYAKVNHTFPEFLDTVGSAFGTSVPGSGSGVAVNGVVDTTGFTSTDIINGTMYLGFAINTTAADAGLGPGFFRTSALSWTAYTGTDVPTPPGGTSSAAITNPVYNTNGITAPGQFQSLAVTVLPAFPADLANAAWTLPSSPGIPANWFTFASNGLTTIGTGINSGTSWQNFTGLINVAAAAVPGVYGIRCDISGLTGPQSIVLFSSLVVLPAGGGWFFEF